MKVYNEKLPFSINVAILWLRLWRVEGLMWHIHMVINVKEGAVEFPNQPRSYMTNCYVERLAKGNAPIEAK